MTIARHLGLRLFLEGIEVPVISASVTARTSGPATADIVIPPDDMLHFLLPRTLCHLFYFADSNKMRGTVFTDKDGNTETKYSGDSDVDVTDPLRWHLLYAGEIVGYGYEKTLASRAITLLALDFTSYWDAAHLYFGKKGGGNKEFKQAIFMGAVVATRGKSKIDSSNKLVRLLRSRPSTIPSLQGLLGGCVHLLESVTGVYADSAAIPQNPKKKGRGQPRQKKFRGLSDWLSQAELRLKLTRQLGVNPNDLSSQILTGNKEFSKWLTQVVKKSRSTSSYGDLVRMLLSYTHHIYATQVCPPFIPEGASANFLKLELVTAGGVSKEDKALLGDITKATDKFSEALDARSEEVYKKVTPEPSDQITPEQVSIASKEEDLFRFKVGADVDAIDRVTPDTEAQGEWIGTWKGKVPGESQVKDLKARAEAEDEPGAVSKENRPTLVEAAKLLGTAQYTFEHSLMATTEPSLDYPGDTHHRHNKENFMDARRALEKVRAMTNKAKRPKYKTVRGKLKLNNRLITTLFHPYIWMCPPPVCNVLFPENYRHLSFRRDWLKEPTRYMLVGLKRSGREDWSHVYYAPNTDIISGSLDTVDVAKAANQSQHFLFEHEKYSGIVPVFNGVGNAAALTKLNKAAESQSPDETFPYGASGKNKALERAAHSNFFFERYKGRILSFSGPFNPNLVNGLPCLIIDPQKNVKTPGAPWVSGSGTHYLGFLTSVIHEISQKGATTAGYMQFARTHNEGLSIFGKYEPKVYSFSSKILKGGAKGRKLPDTYWAEVLGYRTKKRKEGGEFRTVYVPIIGMMGVKGRTGRHITIGLRFQSKKIKGGKKGGSIIDEINKMVVQSEKLSGNRNRIRTKDSGQEFELAGGTIGSPKGMHLKQEDIPVSVIYSVRAVYKKAAVNTKVTAPSTGFGAIDAALRAASAVKPPGTINRKMLRDGYHYKPRMPWMSPKSKGAVEVSAYFLNHQPPDVKEFKHSFSFEQVARPPWYDVSYLNQFIGDRFYKPLLGCSAITDPTVITRYAKPDAISGREGDQVTPPLSEDEQVDKVLKDVEDMTAAIRELNEGSAAAFEKLVAESELSEESKITVKFSDGKEMVVPAVALGGTTIQETTEALASAYRGIQGAHAAETAHMDTFIQRYTNRAFATMEDIFGRGWKKGTLMGPDPEAKSKPDSDKTPKSTGVLGTFNLLPFEDFDPSGEFTKEQDDAREGFHSAAFGPLKNLDLLPHEPLADLYGGGTRAINPDVDPRAMRYKRVLQYRHSIVGIKAKRG